MALHTSPRTVDPKAARDFAVEVVRKLRESGYVTYWAGGSVRDLLLGRTPKDYDVATSARPDEVRRLFGPKRTIPIGVAFGIITVIGPARAGHVEVATFRRDSPYADGRHPDHVEFSDPRHDAMRRDFTINGLFYDPLEADPDRRVIDYVGGKSDIERRLLRAIGDAHARFGEDWLRMLRAVRFTATYELTPDAEVIKAVRAHADKILGISPERITAEMQMMLEHPRRRRAVELLRDWGLLREIFPELDRLAGTATWHDRMEILDRLEHRAFALSLAVLLEPVTKRSELRRELRSAARRWRLSNHVRDTTIWLLETLPVIDSLPGCAWSALQPIVIDGRFELLADLIQARWTVQRRPLEPLQALRAKCRLPAAEIDPPPLLTGDDLKQAGWRPGPEFGRVLQAVRAAQLDGTIATRDEALAMANDLLQ